MAFERLTFTRSWTDSQAFPTYEADEGKVREDLQLLHDETRDGINRLVDALNAASAAAQLPVSPVEGLTAETVQQAIEEVFATVQDAAAAKLINGSVTKEKLEAALLKRIYGGRVWVSMNVPTAENRPETDFPVGQLWLRPAYVLKNLVTENWEVSGGTVEAGDEGWVFTTDGTDSGFVAQQTISVPEAAGQRAMVQIKLGQISPHLNGVKLYLNSLEVDAEEGGCFEAEFDALGNLELQLYAEWPDEEAGETVELLMLTAVNTQQVDETVPGCEPVRNWVETLTEHGNFTEQAFPMELWLQSAAGVWQLVGGDVMPVSVGGTGLSAVQPGALLYGTGGKELAQLPAMENGIVQWSGGKPQMLDPESFAKNNRYPLIMTGQYTGTGGNADRTLELELETVPQFLMIYPADGSCDTACVANGGKSSRTFPSYHNGATSYYEAWVTLSGKNLIFSNERRGNYAGQMLSQHMNAQGVQYHWIAVCGGVVRGHEAAEGAQVA